MELEIKEEISGGIFFQYINSIASVLAGFIFYIYIIHFYSSELVGTVALLLAITSLLNIFFSLGLGYGLQHYISYHMGRQEYGKIREMTTKFLPHRPLPWNPFPLGPLSNLSNIRNALLPHILVNTSYQISRH